MYINNQRDTKGINKVKTSCLFQESQTREQILVVRQTQPAAANMGRCRREVGREKKGGAKSGGGGSRIDKGKPFFPLQDLHHLLRMYAMAIRSIY